MKLNYCIKYGIKIIALMVTTQAFARWEVTNFDQKFKNMSARNGMLVGVEAKTNFPYKWEKPAWKRLGGQEFLSLTTDGTTIAGIAVGDQNAYVFDRNTWKRPTPKLFLSFNQLIFSQKKLMGISMGISPNDLPFVFVWNSPLYEDAGSMWEPVGSQKFWSIAAEGPILCGVQQSYEREALNNLVFIWQKNNWKQMSKQQFQQIATNGKAIYGIAMAPKAYAFVWAGKDWKQLGTEKFTQIAANADILCGIQERIQLALLWIGQKWIALDTKKFTQIATDGRTIYGLANDQKIYYWTSRA